MLSILIESIFYLEEKTIRYTYQQGKSKDYELLNEGIRAIELLVIDDEGQKIGILSKKEALTVAVEKGLDIFIVNNDANPPVAKLMNYSKHQYELKRKQKENLKSQKIVQVKEIRFTPVIEKHDFETKLKHAKKFLAEGDKLKVSVRFKKRMIAKQDLGKDVLLKFVADLGDCAVVEQQPKLEGKMLFTTLGPKVQVKAVGGKDENKNT
jgi:translation initiation factor IF-3